MTVTVPSPADFLAAPPAAPRSTQGNTPWAAKAAREYADVVSRYSDRRPRSLQKHIGPSELGVACDRQIVGKLVGEEKVNHVSDPWPSFVGTAIHAELEQVFQWDNEQRYSGLTPWDTKTPPRWHTEKRVTPFDGHPGTADLYDAHEQTLGDHKCLGDSSMAKVKSAAGPPRKYQAQMGLYGVGYMREGFPVKRVALIAWPRTGSSLHQVYVWERAMDESYIALVAEVISDTKRRKDMASLVQAGAVTLEQIPVAPSGDECHFCPFFSPAARNGGPGCPGTTTTGLV
jgi:hypothetical protein